MHIVCMNIDDWLQVEKREKCTDFPGVVLSSGIEDDFHYFTVMCPGSFESEERMLSTVIRRLAHVLDSAAATTFHPAL